LATTSLPSEQVLDVSDADAVDASLRDLLASAQAGPLVGVESDLDDVAFALQSGDSSPTADPPVALPLDVTDDEAGVLDEPAASPMLLEDPANDRGIAGGPTDVEQSADSAFDEEEFWLEALVV
jgi:hypothetical protein